MGRVFTAADDVQWGWTAHARCSTSHREHDAIAIAWTIAKTERATVEGREMSGRKLIQYALLVCSGCPVQYDCARTAILTEASAGTWGATLEDLRWLIKKHRDPLGVIDAAEATGESVQVAVRRAKLTK